MTHVPGARQVTGVSGAGQGESRGAAELVGRKWASTLGLCQPLP